ncbi:hypothetical protein D1872_280650 [compost metagenome]
MGFVINLSTKSYSYPDNDYGYWTGKTYMVDREEFPVCEPNITENTKVYVNKRRTESMARKLFDRCPHVSTWEIETVD